MDYKLVGSPCGEHGPYTFYKALKYTKNGKTNILALSEFFFVKLWTDSDLISIGELQLLWEDKNNEQTLASLRLYILPENTPDGRLDIHGEDEVLAITEKVVIRVEDLLTWITQATDWSWGLGAVWDRDCPQAETTPYNPIALDMEDVNKEKQSLGLSHWETQTGVVVLSYPRYCRYRGIIKRLESVEDNWLKTALVIALGGFTTPWKDTRILFCKETFDYPELEGHELLCNHLAPKLKGRPRKRKRTSLSPDGSESESESSHSAGSSTSKLKPPTPPRLSLVKPRLRCTPLEVGKRPNRGPSTEERAFLLALHTFMRDRKTPIARIPIVGFKEVNLWKLYSKVKELGGYEVVTSGKLWRFVYEVMGGNMSSTSAAALSRRHYEKLLLPYERHVNLLKPVSKIRPTLSCPPVPLPHMELKGKTSSSLRSIRLKQEKVVTEKENIPQRREAAPKPIPVEPEIIDLDSYQSPPKGISRDLSPLLKKQKLEILKEGGLEVTPVSAAGSVSGSRNSVSVIKPPPPSQSKSSSRSPPGDGSQVSITVTPDMSHLLCSPGPSRRPVYSNPKEMFGSVAQPSKKAVIPEVLDLRTKPKLNIGSNLEITLVPPSKPKSSQSVPPALPLLLPKKKYPSQTPPYKVQMLQNSSLKPPIQYHQPYPGSYKPFVPVVDPLYLSALYNQGAYPHPPPRPEQLRIYKEFFRQTPVFPALIRDGTTSITLVGQTPTSK